MRKKIKGLIVICVGVVILSCSVICMSAIETPDVTMNFDDGTACGFIAPGDLNANGSTSADDFTILRSILMNTSKASYKDVYADVGSNAKYADTNGDGSVDVRDLVRAKKSATKIFIEDNVGVNGSAAMNIYGNVAYSGGLSDMLETDRYYNVSITYKADESLKLTVNGISNQVYTFESAASDSWTTKTYLIATAEKFTSTDIELQICGSGVVDNIVITPCTIDNDLTDNW